MSAPMPFEPRRFRTAAAHYLEGRPAYAPALIRRVAELCGVDRNAAVLDLGCGPGQLALAFAALGAPVTAIDPEPEMLRLAAAGAAGAGAALRLIEGSSYDLGPELGRFRLVTIGRAFHWMDRIRTLATLDGMVEATGAVVLFGDSHPDVPDNAWRASYRDLIERHAGQDAGRSQRKSPDWPSHEVVLLDSAFCRLERAAVIERRQTPVDRLLDRALSMSSTSPGRLGDGAEALLAGLRALLAPFARDGLVTEVVESRALIARRPVG